MWKGSSTPLLKLTNVEVLSAPKESWIPVFKILNSWWLWNFVYYFWGEKFVVTEIAFFILFTLQPISQNKRYIVRNGEPILVCFICAADWFLLSHRGHIGCACIFFFPLVCLEFFGFHHHLFQFIRYPQIPLPWSEAIFSLHIQRYLTFYMPSTSSKPKFSFL